MKNSISKNSVADKPSVCFSAKEIYPKVNAWYKDAVKSLDCSPVVFLSLPNWMFSVPSVLRLAGCDRYAKNLDSLLVVLTCLVPCEGEQPPSTMLDLAGIDSACDKDIVYTILGSFLYLVRKACVYIAMTEYGL